MILVPALLGLVRLVASVGQPFDFTGDSAIAEAAIRRVATGTQTLGPYSRYGFHQPGPAYFFLQAPFYWLTGASSRSLFVGALALNFGCAAAAVLVIRRFLGEPAARWGAVVIAAYLVAFRPALLTDPWNPFVLALPLLLALMLGAGAATGSGAAAAGFLVVGSYLVQSHVATGPVLAATVAVAAGALAAGRIRPRVPQARRAVVMGCGALLLVFWIPPLVEQATGSPGNLTIATRFFTTDHPELDAGIDHRMSTAAGQVAGELTVLPFGAPSNHAPLTPARPARKLVALAGLVVAGGVMAGGWRRRQPFLVALGGLSVATCLVAAWSTTRIVGPVLPYLLVWSSALLVPAWIGAGTLLPDRRPVRALTLGAALTAGAVLAWSMVRAPLPPFAHSSDVTEVTRIVRPWLKEREVRQVRVRIESPGQYALAAGVLVRLDKAGFEATVDPPWVPVYGDQFSPSDREQAVLWLAAPATTPPGDPSQLGTFGGTTVWAGPFDSGPTVGAR